jgi:hypothetical protein
VPDGRHAFLFSAPATRSYHPRVHGPDLLRRGLVPSLLLAAVSLPAQTLRLAGPSAGDRLLPGSVVEASWGSDATPGGFDEGELVLSLDGGRTFPIRVTAEIEPGERRAEWRVPSLPTAHARLALRVGREEAAEAERIDLVSVEFAIVADPSALEERFFRIGCEWRTREALKPRPRRIPRSALAPPAALSALADADESAAAPRPPSLPVPALDLIEIASGSADPPTARAGMPRAFGPASPPLRL